MLNNMKKLKGIVSLARQFSTTNILGATIKKKICVVGAGPAGFYAAQYISKHLPDSHVDIIERLPVPFGLVRFGVAPDHPEVKNVISTFTKTAEDKRVRFLGNLSLGVDVTLNELREKYHAVLLTYGADKDRVLGIPNEDQGNVISAREFVAWYNGLPGAENLNPNLSGRSATIIGQGNVAVDVARILLSPIDSLKSTDITAHALDGLAASKIERVHLVGRRGPLQAAFTIKELREMLKLKGCTTKWRPNDFDGVSESVETLARPRKRITELMLKSLSEQKGDTGTGQQFIPIFFRSPKSITSDGIELGITKLSGDKAIETGDIEMLPSDVIFRSIGYKSINVDAAINFDEKRGLVNNVCGRMLRKSATADTDYTTIDDIEDKYVGGLYVSGWLGTGPTGVIITTMNNSFSVADTICKDFVDGKIPATENKPGLDIGGRPVVTWDKWLKIDKAEMEAGKKVGKPREKILKIDQMLKVAGV